MLIAFTKLICVGKQVELCCSFLKMHRSVVDELVPVNSHKRSLMVCTTKWRSGQAGLERHSIYMTDEQHSRVRALQNDSL